MAKHRGGKKKLSKKKGVTPAYAIQYQNSSSYDDPINSFFQSYSDENFDDTRLLKEELNKLRGLVSQTLNSNNRYRAEILESYNILSKLVTINSKLHKTEFEILDDRIETKDLEGLRFKLALIKTLLDKVNYLDEELDILNDNDISKINQYLVKHLKISDYLLNNGFLLIKIYYKILNLKNFLSDKILNFYIKARLLVIYFELQRIDELLDAQKDSLVKDQQDFKSVLISYKDFILVLINQLNDAIEQRNSEQINECLNILKDVEKMYESFRMNFLFEQELEEYNLQIMESEYDESVESTPPTTSNSSKTTISAELPYLLHAFDEARNLDREISSLKDLETNNTKKLLGSTVSTTGPSTLQHNININNQVKEPAHIHSHLPHKKLGVPTNVGFNNNLLNSIYGLNPKTSTVNLPSHYHNEVD